MPAFAAQPGIGMDGSAVILRPAAASFGVPVAEFPEGEWQAQTPDSERSLWDGHGLAPDDNLGTEISAGGQLAESGRLRWAQAAGWIVLAGLTVAGLERWVGRRVGSWTACPQGPAGTRTRRLMNENAELTRRHRFEFEEKNAALQAAETARLTALRYQLDPHFLFNVLTSISASLPAGEGPARGMVEHLADFYRLALQRGDGEEWTTLGEETGLLRTYFAIEHARWGDLLDVQVAVEPGLEGVRLPHFLLLPLVENAVKYGRATSSAQIGVRLSVRRVAGAILIEVANSGEWVEPSVATRRVPSLGVGLANVRERLARLYPNMHELLLSHADGWVAVSLRLADQPAA
jgi:sensor histidine kinase YesM